MTNNSKNRRLFFALWPDDQIRHQIVENFSQLPHAMHGRVVQTHNLHMTLHFVGLVTEDIKECMHAVAETIGAYSFVCNLDCYGYFPHAKIFWMGCKDMPDELIQLHHQLGTTLENCGYGTEARSFTPHVTLMKKYAQAESLNADFSIEWPVDEFALIESLRDKHGVYYQPIEKYPLSSDKTGKSSL